jgi:hypothetical protein
MVCKSLVLGKSSKEEDMPELLRKFIYLYLPIEAKPYLSNYRERAKI